MEPQTALTIPMVTGLIEMIKRMYDRLPNKYTPLLALALGVAFAFLTGAAQEVGQRIVEGIVTGLAASGLYAQAKTTLAPTPTPTPTPPDLPPPPPPMGPPSGGQSGIR